VRKCSKSLNPDRDNAALGNPRSVNAASVNANGSWRDHFTPEKCEICLWFLKPVLLLLLVGYISWDILLAIYQTAVIFFTAVIAYFLINKPFRSSVSIFTQAEKAENILEIRDDLHETSEGNDIKIAAEILKVLKLQNKYYTKKTK